ncbi:MAG: hypothetical protein Q7S59_04265 [Sulfurimonas sp.]|nr:hypothetical protein [Sulfurimonas sp.]
MSNIAPIKTRVTKLIKIILTSSVCRLSSFYMVGLENDVEWYIRYA